MYKSIYRILDRNTFDIVGYDKLDELGWSMSGQGGIRVRYTGFTDKNGEMIYEGDILLISGRYPAKIIWNENNGSWDSEDRRGDSAFFLSFLEEHVIIGNIYKNPDLLNNDD